MCSVCSAKKLTGYNPPRGINLSWVESRQRWRVGWREGGRQRFETFVRRGDADACARKLADALDRTGRDGLRAMSGEDARELALIRASLNGATIGQLLGVWERHRHEVGAGDKRGVSEAIEDYLTAREKRVRSAEAHRHVRVRLRRFGEWAGKRTLCEISRGDVKAWLASTGWQGFTLKSHFAAVRAFFAHAVSDEWVRENPAEGVKLPHAEIDEVSVISIENARKLFAANADNPVVVRMALEAFGGLRNSSAKRLQLVDINWTERGILLPGKAHKSGRRHYLENLPPNLWAWLEAWRDRPEAWSWKGSQLMHAKSRAVSRAGLKLPVNVLRHSFASYHVALHADAAKTAILMQHTNQAMLYRHYKGIASKADAEAFFAIHPWGPFIPEPKKAPVA